MSKVTVCPILAGTILDFMGQLVKIKAKVLDSQGSGVQSGRVTDWHGVPGRRTGRHYCYCEGARWVDWTGAQPSPPPASSHCSGGTRLGHVQGGWCLLQSSCLAPSQQQWCLPTHLPSTSCHSACSPVGALLPGLPASAAVSACSSSTDLGERRAAPWISLKIRWSSYMYPIHIK